MVGSVLVGLLNMNGPCCDCRRTATTFVTGVAPCSVSSYADYPLSVVRSIEVWPGRL